MTVEFSIYRFHYKWLCILCFFLNTIQWQFSQGGSLENKRKYMVNIISIIKYCFFIISNIDTVIKGTLIKYILKLCIEGTIWSVPCPVLVFKQEHGTHR